MAGRQLLAGIGHPVIMARNAQPLILGKSVNKLSPPLLNILFWGVAYTTPKMKLPFQIKY
jgi:hypothetical protein